MKHTFLFVAIVLAFFSNLFAQNSVETILTGVEKNNTTLPALRKRIDAEKSGNKTGIYLQNPEVEFSYLWGNPSAIGNRTDFSIKQTFDFPTAYRFKNQISELKNEQMEFEYQKNLKLILFETKLICSDLIYTNALQSELKKRGAHAQQIADSYRSKFDNGEVNILEYNKAQLNLLNADNALKTTEVERNSLLAELTRLNGGQPVTFSDSIFQPVAVPADFEDWFVLAAQNNPLLTWLKKEIEISEKQMGLNKAMTLPKFQAGFMSETVVGEQFQGVTVGLSIPLWENKNKVKYAKANTLALKSIDADNRVQFYNHLKALHSKATDLHKNVTQYRADLRSFDNFSLLKKALDKGEISLINYLAEISIYYESVNQLLVLERDLDKTLAELNRFW